MINVNLEPKKPLYMDTVTEGCPFCKRENQEMAFLESDNFLALYNIAPILRGHSLVVPKRHAVSLMDLNETESAELVAFSRKVTLLLQFAFKSDGFDWSLQDGINAGQTVSHFHLHIVIRSKMDLGGQDWFQLIQENNKTLLDSSSRPRLSDDEYLFYTEYIKDQYKKMNQISED